MSKLGISRAEDGAASSFSTVAINDLQYKAGETAHSSLKAE
jgi:hypothetical protein